jgi:hypothetical protein
MACACSVRHEARAHFEIKKWWSTIGAEIGQTDILILTGSIGAAEALVSVDVRCRDLAELNNQWAKLGQRSDHAQFAKEIEPLIVSGSTRWEVLRVIE